MVPRASRLMAKKCCLNKVRWLYICVDQMRGFSFTHSAGVGRKPGGLVKTESRPSSNFVVRIELIPTSAFELWHTGSTGEWLSPDPRPMHRNFINQTGENGRIRTFNLRIELLLTAVFDFLTARSTGGCRRSRPMPQVLYLLNCCRRPRSNFVVRTKLLLTAAFELWPTSQLESGYQY